MSTGYTTKTAHDVAITASEGKRQAAVAAAGNSQSAVRAAELTHARACLASSLVNNGGADVSVWNTMLRELGVNS
jgi:RecA/RadA recombinase